MENLKERIESIILNTMSNKEIAEKCEQVSKEYTMNVLDGLTQNSSGGSFNELYIRIAKTKMAIQAGEI